jgi:rhodanese-related sulfurtransferase
MIKRLWIARLALVVVAVLASGATLAACSDDGGSETSTAAEPEANGTDASADPAPGEEAASAALEAGRTVIDVRTPEEYDAGHIADAQLIDIQASDFAAKVGELDPDGEYVVYCRSGNRSAAAAEEMRALGLDVLDGGGMGDMTAAGWPAA